MDFTFGVEIFEPGHKTTPHRHDHAHELFFILAGKPAVLFMNKTSLLCTTLWWHTLQMVCAMGCLVAVELVGKKNTGHLMLICTLQGKGRASAMATGSQ